MNATITKRPRERDEAVIKAACEKLAERLEEEYPDDFLEPQRVQTVADLSGAVSNAYRRDGYEIARELDSRFHWEVDAQMVEVLDGFGSDLWQACNQAVREWVRLHNIQPKLAVGTKVMTPAARISPALHTGASWECEIVKIDAELGTYTLFCPSAGHVREGVGTHGAIFPFEEVEALGGAQ